jgi:hypothetical protein
LERIWKEAVMALFKVLSWQLPRWTEESHENFQSVQSVSGPRFETGTSQIQSRSANFSAAVFGVPKYHTVKVYRESGGKVACILDFSGCKLHAPIGSPQKEFPVLIG